MNNRTIALLVVVLVLAGGFVYYYGQVSSLKQAGSTVCQESASLAANLESLISNTTLTLQNQIQGDNSLIQTLNSTHPAGYASMIATLKTQVAQDLALIGYYERIEPTTAQAVVSSISNPCLSFK
jgi:hypothetical protein